MIAGGNVDGDDTMTEVVELVKTNSTPSFGQLPSNIHLYAVGAMFGNAPILCGGFLDDTCITYHQDSGWIQSMYLSLYTKIILGNLNNSKKVNFGIMIFKYKKIIQIYMNNQC